MILFTTTRVSESKYRVRCEVTWMCSYSEDLELGTEKPSIWADHALQAHPWIFRGYVA